MFRKLAFVTLWLSVPALAQTTAPPPTPAPVPSATAQKADPLDRMVCKAEETVGTRLGRHKVCATVREWQEQAAENRVATEAMQGVGTGCPEGGSGPGC